jgi:hypothetical protein
VNENRSEEECFQKTLEELFNWLKEGKEGGKCGKLRSVLVENGYGGIFTAELGF